MTDLAKRKQMTKREREEMLKQPHIRKAMSMTYELQPFLDAKVITPGVERVLRRTSNPAQPRDAHGRWTPRGSGAGR